MTERRSVPATPEEAADSFSIMRALLATLLVNRPTRRIKVTLKQRWNAYGVLMRLALLRDGSIEAWLEEPDGDRRTGVVYVDPPK